ncbi:MAG: VOC family protein [Parvularculales bacterium]
MAEDNPSIISHVGFFASSREEVIGFYDVALEAGAVDDGPPGPRPLYGAPYFGCFLLDSDGHKIEASFWDQTAE